jgi:hypothetical protein
MNGEVGTEGQKVADGAAPYIGNGFGEKLSRNRRAAPPPRSLLAGESGVSSWSGRG